MNSETYLELFRLGFKKNRIKNDCSAIQPFELTIKYKKEVIKI